MNNADNGPYKIKKSQHITQNGLIDVASLVFPIDVNGLKVHAFLALIVLFCVPLLPHSLSFRHSFQSRGGKGSAIRSNYAPRRRRRHAETPFPSWFLFVLLTHHKWSCFHTEWLVTLSKRLTGIPCLPYEVLA